MGDKTDGRDIASTLAGKVPITVLFLTQRYLDQSHFFQLRLQQACSFNALPCWGPDERQALTACQRNVLQKTLKQFIHVATLFFLTTLFISQKRQNVRQVIFSP